MKYYVLIVSNGNLQLDLTTEYTDINSAIAGYSDKVSLYHKDKTVTSAVIKLVNNQLELVDGKYVEFIAKEAQE